MSIVIHHIRLWALFLTPRMLICQLCDLQHRAIKLRLTQWILPVSQAAFDVICIIHSLFIRSPVNVINNLMEETRNVKSTFNPNEAHVRGGGGPSDMCPVCLPLSDGAASPSDMREFGLQVLFTFPVFPLTDNTSYWFRIRLLLQGVVIIRARCSEELNHLFVAVLCMRLCISHVYEIVIVVGVIMCLLATVCHSSPWSCKTLYLIIISEVCFLVSV